MPRAAGCEHCTRRSRIVSAYTEVQEIGRRDDGDGQCNENKEESWSEKIVGQNASLFHQRRYVSCPRVLVQDILLATSEQ
jgi:hypothetical protein